VANRPDSKELGQVLVGWPLVGEAQDLMALRRANMLSAITVLAEPGDITRFDTPRQMVTYVRSGIIASWRALVAHPHRWGTSISRQHARQGRLRRNFLMRRKKSWRQDLTRARSVGSTVAGAALLLPGNELCRR